jgi:peptide/histidine transporter 3/4
MPSRLSTLDKEVPLLSYWEDDPPSRMDFGKVKYGGPFTTEQVEDVKTLIKSIGVILVVSFPASVELNF